MNWPDSPSGGLLGDGRLASATDRPGSVDELRRAVADRVAQGHAIYPQGGATALDFGGVPRSPGVAIDTRGLSGVIDYPAADMTVTVQAGMTLSGLRAILAEKGQRLLIDAPDPDRATLGGIYATNTCGPRRFGAGRPRDQIIGVSFVTAAGVEVKGGGRVVKNVAGYDFPRLMTGSMGTLGVLSQMTLKVRPAPEAAALAWIPFPDPDRLGPALERLNTSDTRPMAIELLNPSAARHVGGGAGLPSEDWTLAIGYEDNAASVAWQLARLKAELEGCPVEVIEGADSIPLWDALTDFQAAELGPIGFVASLRVSSALPFARGIDPGRWAVQVHAGNGIVRGHALRAEDDLELIAAEIDRLRLEAGRDGGSVTLPRCPTAWKERLRVWGTPRPDWHLAERVKDALDPGRVLNPGRFVGTI